MKAEKAINKDYSVTLLDGVIFFVQQKPLCGFSFHRAVSIAN